MRKGTGMSETVTLTNELREAGKPVPWRTLAHGNMMYDDEEPLEVVDAHENIVMDNTWYYPERVEPVVQRVVVRAVNAHDALVEALELAMVICEASGCAVKDEHWAKMESALKLAAGKND